jgi:hypothetical protein
MMYKTLFLISVLFYLSSYTVVPYSSITEKHCQITSNGKVKVYEVNDLGRRYGYSIWLNSASIQVHYHTSKLNNQTVYQRYNSWKVEKRMVLASSGGYSTNNYKKPLGLTIEGGRVVNNLLDSDMDAIVLIYNGSIEIIDISQKMKIETIDETLQLSNYRDKAIFINKVKQLKATVFQTHLLAKGNLLKIKENSDKKVAERKLLAIVKKDNQTFYSLFYIKKGEKLYDVSKKVNGYLKSENYTVKGIVNLDTGVHNILKTYQLKSCTNQELRGESNINTATNLISFYIES